jgi:cell shape-determining protein MreC
MIGVVSSFFKAQALKIVLVLVVAAASAVAWIYVDLQLTKAALETANAKLAAAEAVVEAQQRAIEAVDEVEAYTQQTNAQLRALNRTIMEAEGAQEYVPPAVASAWSTGIASLRTQPIGSGDTAESLEMR